eukprot:TRINITY_DN3364_c0_g1_i1.p1 TRINITY_DN3364_c0_g1~~TRINITY_DN3364_c0_g1_i1.p1  ORF type:complete len:346 (-),score=91.96 TRINITY_DN3364_c0_g1_i1:362-1399(-)
MGLFSAFSDKGKLGIKTHKPYYLAGETVTGTITAKIKQPISCDGIVLKATGVEKVKLVQARMHSETTNDDPPQTRIYYTFHKHEAKKEFFKRKIKIHDVSEVLRPGDYKFDFEYKLPDDIPGVYEDKQKWRDSHSMGASEADGDDEEYEVKVIYKLKATLDVNGMFSKDMKAKQHVVVHRGAPGVEPVFSEKTETVMLCCCIPRGDATVKVWFDKNAYIAGETAQIKAEINNESSSDIGNMKVKLMKFLTLSAHPDGDKDAGVYEARFSYVVDEKKYDGVPSGEKKTMDLPLPISKDHNPSISSKYIECKYQLEVECDISMAPDIEVHLPTTIYASLPTHWGVDD